MVHVCLEGPEAGVYYRGKGEITNDSHVIISLPEYVSNLAYDFTVKITSIHHCKKYSNLQSSEVVNNKFTVYGDNGKFFWLVYGRRNNINVEPNKMDIRVNGNGPYQWYK